MSKITSGAFTEAGVLIRASMVDKFWKTSLVHAFLGFKMFLLPDFKAFVALFGIKKVVYIFLECFISR